MKFGGTSVADADAITRVVGIVKAARESSGLPPVVIVSAMSGVTDRLLELTAVGRAPARRARAERRRRAVAPALRGASSGCCRRTSPTTSWSRSPHSSTISARCSRRPAILRAASPSAHDAIVCTGELINSRIVAAALEQHGVPAAWVDARRAIVTDDGAHGGVAEAGRDARGGRPRNHPARRRRTRAGGRRIRRRDRARA